MSGGVFTTVLVRDGRALFAERHVARLAGDAAALGLPSLAPAPLAEELARRARDLGGRERGLRVAWSSAGELGWTERSLDPLPPGGVELVLSAAHPADDPRACHKTLDRERYATGAAEARRAGAWDALLATDDGELLETTVANVFVVVDGELRTPPTRRGVLPGIVRGILLDEGRRRGRPIAVGPVTLGELRRATEVFVTNALRGVVPVAGWRDAGRERRLPGADGQVTQRVRARYDELARREAGGAAR